MQRSPTSILLDDQPIGIAGRPLLSFELDSLLARGRFVAYNHGDEGEQRYDNKVSRYLYFYVHHFLVTEAFHWKQIASIRYSRSTDSMVARRIRLLRYRIVSYLFVAVATG